MTDFEDMGFEVLTEGSLIHVMLPDTCEGMRQLASALCTNNIEPGDSEMAVRLQDGIPALGYIATEGVASEAQK